MAAALIAAGAVYADAGVTRYRDSREGFIVTYGESMDAEAKFILDYVLRERHEASSRLRSFASDNRDRLLKGAAANLGLKSVPKIMPDMWDTQIQLDGAAFGEFPRFRLVGVDLWYASDYFDRLPGDAGLAGATSLKGTVSPHFHLLVNVRERTIEYVRTAKIGDASASVEDLHIPMLMREDASFEERTRELSSTLIHAGLVRGGPAQQTKAVLLALHEVVEGAYVTQVFGADGRRWIGEGVATWIAVVEGKRAGLIGSMHEALDLIWADHSCDGVTVSARQLYNWPIVGTQREVENQDCYYRASARIFEGLANRYGEGFVRKWFKRVQREPYDTRTVATFERTFAALTKRPLPEVMEEILSEKTR